MIYFELNVQSFYLSSLTTRHTEILGFCGVIERYIFEGGLVI